MNAQRKFETNAERQAAYRTRKNAKDAQHELVAVYAQRIIKAARSRGVVEPTATDVEALKAIASLLDAKG